jgi:signal transduction histidine kinase/putative methionine-R-sulfoxide reductase with GAF domain
MQPKVSTTGADANLACMIEELKRELSEAHRREAATAEVLKLISRSAFNLQSVLDTLIETAVRLCDARRGVIFRREGNSYRGVAFYNASPELIDFIRCHPITAGRDTITARVALERRTVHVADLQADPEYKYALRDADPIRTELGVPMFRGEDVVGVFILYKLEVLPFADKQIELVESFADQAVIAIENARLFEEVQARTRQLTESLEYQTATSEVLNVISRSPSQLQPVLDSIVATAADLCHADFAMIHTLEHDRFRLVAANKVGADYIKWLAQNPPTAGRGSVSGRAVAERGTIHIADVLADPEYAQTRSESLKRGRQRTTLGVPLLREGVPIGVIALHRTEVRPFADKQIELVTTFADQAVIAIENTRLFEEVQARTRELQESLEYQTSISDVLNVISRSTTNVQPVFDAIVKSVARLFERSTATITRLEGGQLHYTASASGRQSELDMVARVRAIYPLPFEPELSPSSRAILEQRIIEVLDAAGPDTPEFTRQAQQALGFRSATFVPLIREGRGIGAIALAHPEPGFKLTDTQRSLVQTFADQAVIAIENARLFEEVQARTRELAKTVEDLEIASQHKSQFVANMSHELRTPLAAILGYAELMQEGFYEAQGPKSLDALIRIRSNGKHLLGLINTVLDVAKIESGQFTLNMTEYAIESVVETVRSATESLAQSKNLALKTEVAKSLPIGLGDEQRLTQVLLNLVGNAIKFTDTGEVLVTANAVDEHFSVTVADTGPGIPSAEQARIFEQFHQVDSSLTKAKGGTGLGLAIAKQIVEMHGGRIWVESTVGKGSTFQIEFPTRAESRPMS